MKKSILNLGKTLEKAEQKEINGGFGVCVCIVFGTPRIVDCNSICPDGTSPFSGLA